MASHGSLDRLFVSVSFFGRGRRVGRGGGGVEPLGFEERHRCLGLEEGQMSSF